MVLEQLFSSIRSDCRKPFVQVQLLFEDGRVASEARLDVWTDKDPVSDLSSSYAIQPDEMIMGPWYGGQSFIGSPALSKFGLVVSYRSAGQRWFVET